MAVQQGILSPAIPMPDNPAEIPGTKTSRKGRAFASRVKKLAQRRLIANDSFADASATRILTAISTVAGAESTNDWAAAITRTLPTINGLEIVAVLFSNHREGRLKLASKSECDDIADTEVENLVASVTANHASVIIDPADLPSRDLRIGLVTPVTSHGLLLGALCAFSSRLATINPDQVSATEKFVGLATPFLITVRSRGNSLIPTNRLDQELLQAGRLNYAPSRPRIDLDGISLDPMNDKSVVGEVAISLSRSEFDILYTLAESPGTPVQTTAIVSSANTVTNLDVAIHRLRKKLAKVPLGQQLVQNVRGKGYMLVPPTA